MRAWFYAEASETPYPEVTQGPEIHKWFFQFQEVADELERRKIRAVVRDPVERAISCYFDKFEGNPDFDSIEDWVFSLEVKWHSQRHWDEHVRPMHFFVPPSAEVIKLENLLTEMERLKASGEPHFIPVNKKRNKSKPEVSGETRKRIANLYLRDIVRFYPDLLEMYGLTH